MPAGEPIQDIETDDYQSLKALLPKNWLSPRPLRKVLAIKQVIDQMDDNAIKDLFTLALVAITVEEASNLGFGPEVYVKKKREDARVYSAFASKLRQMRYDLEAVQRIPSPGNTQVHCGDARQLSSMVDKNVDFVITSPPMKKTIRASHVWS